MHIHGKSTLLFQWNESKYHSRDELGAHRHITGRVTLLILSLIFHFAFFSWKFVWVVFMRGWFRSGIWLNRARFIKFLSRKEISFLKIVDKFLNKNSSHLKPSIVIINNKARRHLIFSRCVAQNTEAGRQATAKTDRNSFSSLSSRLEISRSLLLPFGWAQINEIMRTGKKAT